jgi:hypothetical protein
MYHCRLLQIHGIPSANVSFDHVIQSDSLQRGQSELVGEVGSVHGVGQILLVGENEQKSVPQLVLAQHSLDYIHTTTIQCVHDVRIHERDHHVIVINW